MKRNFNCENKDSTLQLVTPGKSVFFLKTSDLAIKVKTFIKDVTNISNITLTKLMAWEDFYVADDRDETLQVCPKGYSNTLMLQKFEN